MRHRTEARHVWRALAMTLALLAALDAREGMQPAAPAAPVQYGALPLSFEANRGQAMDDVAFLCRASGYRLFVTPVEAIFALKREREDASPAPLRMRLAGARTNAEVTGRDRLPGVSHYLIGRDRTKWCTIWDIHARNRAFASSSLSPPEKRSKFCHARISTS